MSEAKYREALKGLLHEDGGTLAFSAENPKAVAAREALAHPAEAVELTDEDIQSIANSNVEQLSYHHPIKGLIFGQTFDNLRFARAVIAAHEAKRRQQ